MTGSSLPFVEALPRGISAVDVFCRLRNHPHVVFFDNCDSQINDARYSFVAVDPFQWITAPADGSDGLGKLQLALNGYQEQTVPGLPPFQGGAAGIFGYELALSLERLSPAKANDLPVPAMAVGLYDLVVAFDHQKDEAWMISQGFPESDPDERKHRARHRLEELKSWLAEAPSPGDVPSQASAKKLNVAPQFEVELEGVTSNMSGDSYLNMIRQAVEYIHSGEVFQVNLAQRLLCPARSSSHELYLRLREKNPAPYAGYIDVGDWQVCSTSPECFLTVRGNQVETRPIKGTSGRFGTAEADLFAGNVLQQSEKDRAENVMIVDLLRNDLSRVCEPDSVRVTELCNVETYSSVKHLVSCICGTLRDGASSLDLFRACFPGGSITGAPKIRAMQIIAELEPTCRGPYCGSLAYLGFDGQMDSNILIRTVTAGGSWWQLPVGGGIVAQSIPEQEYRETWHKARSMLDAIKA